MWHGAEPSLQVRAAPRPAPQEREATGGGPALPQLAAAVLERELQWLETVLQARLSLHFGQSCAVADVQALPPPSLAGSATPYAQLVAELGLGFDERLLLILALAPHLRPALLDCLFVRNKNLERGFSEFGGWKGQAHGGFLPTGETAAFLLAGEDLGRRLQIMALLDEAGPLRQRDLLRLTHDAPGEPFFSAPLTPGPEYLAWLTTGTRRKPDYSVQFPAKLIHTALGWNDLVLAPEVMAEVRSLTTWVQHGHRLMREWRLDKVLKPGYRSLFFGPPGTGKTLTATLIGQATGTDVYRIDLSMVVSKYIGETEKNLAQVFDQAEQRDWILFFDEADALFGKRTAASSSNDRHANQEVAYLLQRVEDFPGTVILASNLQNNLDDAFARRFQSMLYFPMPDAEQRLRLWENLVRHTGRLADEVNLEALAEAHELSGGAIANVLRCAALNAWQAGRERIHAADLALGVTKELRKEGRSA